MSFKVKLQHTKGLISHAARTLVISHIPLSQGSLKSQQGDKIGTGKRGLFQKRINDIGQLTLNVKKDGFLIISQHLYFLENES